MLLASKNVTSVGCRSRELARGCSAASPLPLSRRHDCEARAPQRRMFAKASKDGKDWSEIASEAAGVVKCAALLFSPMMLVCHASCRCGLRATFAPPDVQSRNRHTEV